MDAKSPARPFNTDLSDKTILVTGGTGSFGGVVVRKMLALNCRAVRIPSRDEAKQYNMREALDDPRLSFYLGDVRDRPSVDLAIRDVDLVFHAAALKQAPNCESFPDQAVLTNVLGSQNVLRSAVEHHIEKVVCLSTDKAVHPVNVMGMTKALMEKNVQALSKSIWSDHKTILCAVRYGNVLYSRGSVVPLFIDQIKRGVPISLTIPEMTRFLLRLDDAVSLVETALTAGRPGDIFIRKSPASSISDLAEAVRSLFKSNVPIRIVGSRPGEKLHETLATSEEIQKSQDLGEALRIPIDTTDLIDPNPELSKAYTQPDYTSENTRRLSLPEVVSLLASLPELQRELALA
ncbi:MAG: NAD-dependent epimerase/dehydratase family protein [Alphaproteobacteria bacterium]|nr:NAD-dependent epimerase/dehydratase family protein [Alphaproteobacteria bacterium]